ncbi:predicted protein [Naegleria gruberi]|uniref:Predicted protein n=1 Tax=Naegleria gruberi TaxID=5762 RepID=D2V2N1_NAEGR|nr:uncharacterized protein NAEGRDRAFT_63056 [Naegleria gruberi]EFC49090.1 predicted protein [Naegleria gruberi]|eukprot:XP_002681834.1 predicted protein [Naegleria gruberi strain NEG-M]
MKGISRLPQTTAAMHNNLERVFSVLRDNKTIELRFLWSTKEVISGDYDTIWGLLNDIYNAYWKKTSKVKRASQNKKRENSRIQAHSPNSSLEEEREDENEGFSIEDINRMKRELLESSQDY